jgi:ABC-type transport system substrate-binding protein
VTVSSRTRAALLLLSAAVLVFSPAAWAESRHPLKIGLGEEPRTLNVWMASDANSNNILSQIYQPLYRYAPAETEMVPWLAAGPPEMEADGVTYQVRLRPARWSDGSAFTAADVAFTCRLIKEFKIPRHYSRWKFVDRIDAVDDRTVRFVLKEPMAIFLTRSLTIPIVSEKEWREVADFARKQKKPLATLFNHTVQRPLGTGPFVLEKWHKGAFLHMKKNDWFFGQGLRIGERLLGPFVGEILFKIYGTSDVAMLALKKGAIDMYWQGIQPGYIENLEQHPEIRIFSSERSALYYLGFNVRKPPFNDPALRRAAAVLVDKSFIIERILQGYGSRMDSIIPAGNEFWYNPNLTEYGEGLEREQRIRAAHRILNEAGYRWTRPPVDDAGKVQPAEGLRLPDGSPMESVTILTPPADYDPHRAISGLLIQQWLRQAGIPVSARPMAFGALLQQVKTRHDFDAFILGYGRLSLDPDYLRIFFHSEFDRERGWNMSGYHNPEFDRIAEASEKTMDLETRRMLIYEMQEIIARDVPYLPIYLPREIEAVRTDRFAGWVQMLEGIGNIWSFCQLSPVN